MLQQRGRSEVIMWQSARCASHGKCDIHSDRAFSVLGPILWDNLPKKIRAVVVCHPSKLHLKHICSNNRVGFNLSPSLLGIHGTNPPRDISWLQSGHATTKPLAGYFRPHHRDPDHHQTLITCSFYYPGPLHKISLQSVLNFLSNGANRQMHEHNLLVGDSKYSVSLWT